MPIQPPVLQQRPQPSINKQAIKISIDLNKIQTDFDRNIQDIETKFNLAQSILSTSPDSAKDIWRSQIVFLDSALDFYIHEIARFGMSKIINDEWVYTKLFNKFQISMRLAKILIVTPENLNLFMDEIDETNQKNCFMKFENLQKQLKLIGVSIAKDESNENQINNLFKRRNEIAHQADFSNGVKNNITEQEVRDFIDAVKILQTKIQNAIIAKG